MTQITLHHIICSFTGQGLQTVYADPAIPVEVLRQAEAYCRPSGQACLLPEPIAPALGCVFLPQGQFLLFCVKPSARPRHARGAALFGHGLVGDAAALVQLGGDPAGLLWRSGLFVDNDEDYLLGDKPPPCVIEVAQLACPDPVQEFLALLGAEFDRATAIAILSQLLSGKHLALIADNSADRPWDWPLVLYRLLPDAVRKRIGVASNSLMQGYREIGLVACSSAQLVDLFASAGADYRVVEFGRIPADDSLYYELAQKLVEAAEQGHAAYAALKKQVDSQDVMADELMVAFVLWTYESGLWADERLAIAVLKKYAQGQALSGGHFAETWFGEAGRQYPKFTLSLLLLVGPPASVLDWDEDFFRQASAYADKGEHKRLLRFLVARCRDFPQAIRHQLLLSVFAHTAGSKGYRSLCMDAVDSLFEALSDDGSTAEALLADLKKALGLWLDAKGSVVARIDKWRASLKRVGLDRYLFGLLWSVSEEREGVWTPQAAQALLADDLAGQEPLASVEFADKAAETLCQSVGPQQGAVFLAFLAETAKDDPAKVVGYARVLLTTPNRASIDAEQVAAVFAVLDKFSPKEFGRYGLAQALLTDGPIPGAWQSPCADYLMKGWVACADDDYLRAAVKAFGDLRVIVKGLPQWLSEKNLQRLSETWRRWLPIISETPSNQLDFIKQFLECLGGDKQSFLGELVSESEPLPGWAGNSVFLNMQQTHRVQTSLPEAIDYVMEGSKPQLDELKASLQDKLSKQKRNLGNVVDLAARLYRLANRLEDIEYRAEFFAYALYCAYYIPGDGEPLCVFAEAYRGDLRESLAVRQKFAKLWPMLENTLQFGRKAPNPELKFWVRFLEKDNAEIVRWVILGLLADQYKAPDTIWLDMANKILTCIDNLVDIGNTPEKVPLWQYDAVKLLGVIGAQWLRDKKAEDLSRLFKVAVRLPKAESAAKTDSLVCQDLKQCTDKPDKPRAWGSCLCYVLDACRQALLVSLSGRGMSYEAVVREVIDGIEDGAFKKASYAFESPEYYLIMELRQLSVRP